MTNPKNIEIADYDYPLPEERIAKYPLDCRDHSKLLIYKKGNLSEAHFYNLPEQLPADSLLVFNDTKVIHARLLFQKNTGSTIEIFCLEPWLMPVAQSFEMRDHCRWTCFIGNNKKWKEGDMVRELTIEGKPVTLRATRIEPLGNAWVVEFHWTGEVSFAEVIEQAGVIPLPPYLNREAENSDNERYQTVYAEHQGSVAAPTAGLHFSDAVFDALRTKGIGTEFITLHVGAGTFKPVSTATIGEHEMHVERVQITRSNLERIIGHQGHPLIPVGTTTVRTLESVYWFGVKLCQNHKLEVMHVLQWDPYELESMGISTTESYQQVMEWMDRHNIDILDGDTQLLIAPGYHYHVIDGLITNFHQPKSTLLLLVSAYIGEDWKKCYQYALEHDFRFLSYGDSCLFLNTNPHEG